MNRSILTTVLSLTSLLSVLSLGSGCTISTPADGTPGSGSTSTTVPGAPTADGGAVVAAAGCGFGEPNDTRDVPTSIALDTAYTGICLSGREDKDWYQFTAPSDAAGGWVKVLLSNVHNAALGAKAYAMGSNREIITAYTATDGESLAIYFSVKPGEKFGVVVDEFIGGDQVATYDMKLAYTKFDDAFESNDSRDAAKTITAGTAVEAYLAGLESAATPKGDDVSDWYAVNLSAGQASIKIQNIPTDLSPDYELVDVNGTRIDNGYTATNGESLIRNNVAIPATGKYFVRVGAFNHVEDAGKGDVAPDHFTRKYSLLVSQ